jgi:Mor family transcriptional regulator
MTHAIDHIDIDDLPEDCRQLADIIGLDALIALSERFGGDRVYIPMPDRLGIPARNREIREAFTGVNIRALAVKYNLTERWIRVIVSGNDGEESTGCDKKSYKQLSLF